MRRPVTGIKPKLKLLIAYCIYTPYSCTHPRHRNGTHRGPGRRYCATDMHHSAIESARRDQVDGWWAAGAQCHLKDDCQSRG